MKDCFSVRKTIDKLTDAFCTPTVPANIHPRPDGFANYQNSLDSMVCNKVDRQIDVHNRYVRDLARRTRDTNCMLKRLMKEFKNNKMKAKKAKGDEGKNGRGSDGTSSDGSSSSDSELDELEHAHYWVSSVWICLKEIVLTRTWILYGLNQSIRRAWIYPHAGLRNCNILIGY